MTAREVSSEQPGTIDALSATLQKIADTPAKTFSVDVEIAKVNAQQRRAVLPVTVASNHDLSRGGVVWFDVTREGARPFLQAAIKESEGASGAFSLEFRFRNDDRLLSGLASELVAHLRSAIVDASSEREIKIVASVGEDGGLSAESASVVRRALVNDGFRPDQHAFDHWLLNDWSDRGGDAYPGPVTRTIIKKAPAYATTTLPPIGQLPIEQRRQKVAPVAVVDNGSARGRGIKIGGGIAAAALLAFAATRCGGDDDASTTATTTTETPPPPSTVVETVVVEQLPAVDAADLVDTATGGYWLLAADGKLIEGNGAGALKSEQALAEGVVALRGAATPDGAGVFVLGSDLSVLSAGAAPQLARESFVIFGPDNTEFPLTPEWQLPPEWRIVSFAATPTGQGFVLSFDNGIRVAGGDGAGVVRWTNGLVATE